MLRGQKQVDGERKLYMINRMQCTNESCRKIHRQLTDGMIKFKQYTAQVIEDVIDEVISASDAIEYPCEGTMKHWKWWFLYNREQMEGHLRMAVYRLRGFMSGPDSPTDSLLDKYRKDISPGWLGKVCRIVNNIGGTLRVSPE